MIFAEAPGNSRGSSLSNAAVAALAQLQQASFPRSASARALPRTRPLSLAEQLRGWLRWAIALAAGAILVVAAISTYTVWTAASSPSTTVAPGSVIHSSAGATGTSETRVENLGVASFVGGIPFLQQARYMSAASTGGSDVSRFVAGARQADVAGYIDSVGTQVVWSYANDALATKTAADIWRWSSAVEQNRLAAAEAPAIERTAAGAPAWQAPSLAGGSVRNSTITFYSCIGNGFCGNMANGQPVFAGAAACSYDMPMGTQFVINADPAGRVYTCLDRGALATTWVDIWFYDAADGWAWQSIVGTYGQITIIN